MLNKKPKKILIAEDEVIYSDALVFKLEKSGFCVRAVRDGKEALVAIRKEHFDLLLLDLVMPVMNGFEVLQALKKNQNRLPIIVLSNLAQEADEERVKELGAMAFISKANIRIAELVKKIKHSLVATP